MEVSESSKFFLVSFMRRDHFFSFSFPSSFCSPTDVIPCNHSSVFSSEGIQIGGVCSAAGVVGTWTGAHHEEGSFSKQNFVSICYRRMCGVLTWIFRYFLEYFWNELGDPAGKWRISLLNLFFCTYEVDSLVTVYA